MALPPKGDPRRPLHLAAGSSRLLGILLTLLGLLGMVPVFLMRRSVGSVWFFIVQVILGMILYVGPGAMYIVCSVFIVKRRNWAVITSLVLSSFFLLLLLLALTAMGIGIVVSLGDVGIGESIATGAILLLVAGFAQHIVHLAKCFKAIEQTRDDRPQGFEPLMRNADTPANPHESNNGTVRS